MFYIFRLLWLSDQWQLKNRVMSSESAISVNHFWCPVYLFFFCLFGWLFFSSFSFLWCLVYLISKICYSVTFCGKDILLSFLSLTVAGRIFKVVFKRICNDLFQVGIGLLLFDSEKKVVLRCVFLYFENSISKKKVGNLQRLEKLFGKYN